MSDEGGDEILSATAIDPDDPFRWIEPGSSSESTISERVDEVLYGDGSP